MDGEDEGREDEDDKPMYDHNGDGEQEEYEKVGVSLNWPHALPGC